MKKKQAAKVSRVDREVIESDCNKVREVARRRTVMYDDGGMNDETSATV